MATVNLRVGLDDIARAREVLGSDVLETPVVPLVGPGVPEGIWLKLESLQPIGSMKVRGVLSAVRQVEPEVLREGLVTASSGNLGRALAWAAHQAGVPATAMVPDTAPLMKVEAIERFGGEVKRLPYEEWWRLILAGRVEGSRAHFVHPVLDRDVIAGAATVGLEIVSQMGAVGTVLVPFGSGSLALGIGAALAEVSPDTLLIACEPATGAPLRASLEAGRSVRVPYSPSFVDSAGSAELIPGVFENVQPLVAEARAVTLERTAAAIRLLAERTHIVAEGAAALTVGAALAGGEQLPRPVVCVVTGGNIETAAFRSILSEDAGIVMPQPG